ncbi:MAG: hypothetical protein K8U03_10290 [Planctomycetia bacterium]|nr:hypothetical protein [Planctomycetia bacterium]
MKTLLRLALLSLCASGGVLIAIHLATKRPAEVAAVAAPSTAPQPTEKPTDIETTAPSASESQRIKAVANAQRLAARVPRFELIQPRVAAEYQPETRNTRNPTEARAPQYVAQAPATDPNAGLGALLNVLQQSQANPQNQAGPGISPTQTLDLLKMIQNRSEQHNQEIQALQAQAAGLKPPAATPPANGPALGAPIAPPAAPAPARLEEALPTDSKTVENKLDATGRAAEITVSPGPKGEMVDAPGAVASEGDGRLTINARDVDIRILLEQLAEQAGLNILAGQSVVGAVSLNLQHVGVEDALDAILKLTRFVARRDGEFYYIGTSEDFVAMEKAQDRISTRVYRPNYINAKELATVLTPLLTPVTGKISITAPAHIGIASDTAQAGGDSMSQQDALVIQDYDNVLGQIDQVVKDLDRRPAQVSIEAMIVSVTLNDANSFGVDFQVLRDKQNVRFGWGSPRQAPLEGGGTVDPTTGGQVGSFQFDTGGLKFAFLDDSLGVFLNALETVGDANVIASPKLLCLNKQKAEILIGQKLGYISTTVTQNFSTQNVEFLEVGAQLRLRPFISSDGLIRLEVHPELSEGSVVVNGGFTLPQKTLTEVTTNVMCPDGCTVILGGLMRENLRSTTTQVPFMGSLPGVGPLFRSKTENVERVEILILLTPRIVNDGQIAAEGAKFEADAKNMETAKFHRMTPLGQAHLGRDYTDRARTALANNNRALALRYAKLAVHYDPLNRDAIRVLHDVNTAGGATAVSQGFGVQAVIGEGEEPVIDGEMPAWMLEDLGRSEGVVLPEHPGDPGVPGRRTDVVRPEVFRNEKRK